MMAVSYLFNFGQKISARSRVTAVTCVLAVFHPRVPHHTLRPSKNKERMCWSTNYDCEDDHPVVSGAVRSRWPSQRRTRPARHACGCGWLERPAAAIAARKKATHRGREPRSKRPAQATRAHASRAAGKLRGAPRDRSNLPKGGRGRGARGCRSPADR